MKLLAPRMTEDGAHEQLCFPVARAPGSGREGPFAPYGLRERGECPATECVPARVGAGGWKAQVGCWVGLGLRFPSVIQIEGASGLCRGFKKYQPESSNRAVKKVCSDLRGNQPLFPQSGLVHAAPRATGAWLPPTYAAFEKPIEKSTCALSP